MRNMKINIAKMKCDMIRMQVGMHNMDPSTQDEFLHSVNITIDTINMKMNQNILKFHKISTPKI